MSTLAWRGPDATLDRVVAGVCVGAMGVGTAIALAGAASGSTAMSLAGGGLIGLALIAVLAAGWVDSILAVALTAPLPALIATDSLRIATVLPITCAAVAGWLLAPGFDPRPLRDSQLPVRILGALVLVLLVSSAASATPLIALREIANLLILVLLLAAFTQVLFDDPRKRELGATVLAVLCVICSALAVLEAVGVIPGDFPRYDTPYNRATLGFGQPNNLGLFLSLTLPLVVWRAASAAGEMRLVWRGAVALCCLGLLATFSRGSWASVIVGAGAFLLVGRWRVTARLALWSIVAGVALDVVSGGMIRDTFQRTLVDWVVEQRLDLTLAGLLMFRDHPLLGVGPGGFEAQVDQYGIFLPDLFDFQPTPHNAYVQMAAETGVFGLIVYVALLVQLLRTAARRVRSLGSEIPTLGLDGALLWSLGVLTVSGLFLWPLAHGTGEVAVILFALVLSTRRTVQPVA